MNAPCTTSAILGLCQAGRAADMDGLWLAARWYWHLVDEGLDPIPSRCVVLSQVKSPPAASARHPRLSVIDDAYLPLVVRRGLPFACAENVASVLEVPLARLYELMSVSPSTAHRRKKDQLLSNTESDRLARIARITADACRVFGDVEVAKRWLGRPHAVLGKRAPLDLLDTDSGAEQVADELTRIEFGELAA